MFLSVYIVTKKNDLMQLTTDQESAYDFLVEKHVRGFMCMCVCMCVLWSRVAISDKIIHVLIARVCRLYN